MDAVSFLIGVGLIHCCLFFFNVLFRSCSHYPYLYFLQNTGLDIQVLQIKWYTTAFNRMIVKWVMDRLKFWSAWFNIGVIISIILVPVSFLMVMKMSFDLLFGGSAQGDKNSVIILEPMLPGVNMPFNDIGYYTLTLAVCIVVHELGHALAAAREDVQVYGMGIGLIYIVPMAYTDINKEQLAALPVCNKLRVICAGIWHNVFLALVVTIVLIVTTWMWTPFYTIGSGISVKAITHNSPLLGPSGLLVQDVIYKVNDCVVKDKDDWYQCILNAVRQPTSGYCIAQKIFQEYDESVPAKHMSNGAVNCCSADSEINGSLCFEYVEGTQVAPLQLPLHSCLPARIIADQSQKFCQSSQHCSSLGTYCMRPSLDNVTKVVQIKRQEGKDVLFFGYPGDIYRTVDVSDWIPKYNILHSEVPETLALFCKYIIAFSAGLAIINAVPCFCFDSEYITNTLTHYLLKSVIRHKSLRHAIALTITCMGSILFGINAVHMFINKVI
ncbi:membrane-bound transcription factor site-2 protease [Orussus abietinus]|uniref:membrane-bound transcription factor site-2 protease n=1 Tax=Orussus abietinus TaxID=222816 RepID=UPI0006268CB4|nr:membrane-bound transcription factor site-2 protease [Orussus abietinus]